MTDLNLQELKKIAQEATQGAWEINSATCGSEHGDYTIYGIKDVADADWVSDDAPAFAYCEGMTKPDATHIAAFDPPTVLALIARIEKLEAENTLLVSDMKTVNEVTRNTVENLKATVQCVRDLHSRVDVWNECAVCTEHAEALPYPCPTIQEWEPYSE